jgi:polygalacturonase
MPRIISVVLLWVVFLKCVPAQAEYINIRDMGAVGNGTNLNTRMIQNAIDSAARQGGGTVYVPPGVFVTGTLQLRSNVNLHLESGAVLKGSANLNDYLLNGKRVGLLFTQDVENVSITGFGVIDGNGDSFMELDKAKKMDHAGVMWTRQGDQFRHVSEGIGDGPVVPKDRPFQMIIFSDCRKVTVRDVLISNSPFWTLHCADCDGVIISGVRIWCNLLVPNNDGIDLTSCSNAIVSDCDIRTGDDCIAITGYNHHFDLPGYKYLKRPCENITVNNCTMVSRSAAIRIGGFDQNPMRNFTFSNITITNSNRGIGLFVRDQGSIENLLFTNILIETHLHTGDWWGNGEPIQLSAIRLTKDVPLGKMKNIKFQNIVCRGESGIFVYGTEESVIEDVTFNDVRFHLSESKLNDLSGGNFDLRPVLDPKLQLFSHDIPGFYAQYVNNLRIEDLDLTWDPVNDSFFTHGIEVRNFEGVTIAGFRGSAAPNNPKAFPISLHDGKGCEITPVIGPVSKKNVK